MKTFLVGPRDAGLGDPDDLNMIRVIQASSEQEALEKYWANYEPAQSDIEHCCTMTWNWSFLEDLFHDEVGYMFDESTGSLRKDILKTFKDDKEELDAYLYKNVEARARAFFSDRPDYADAYMIAYEKSRDPNAEIRFPKDMIVYMVRKSDYPGIVVREIKVLK